MKLEKAKEIDVLNLKEAGKKMPPDVRDALQLSVEAIDFVTRFRQGHIFPLDYLLPSETED